MGAKGVVRAGHVEVTAGALPREGTPVEIEWRAEHEQVRIICGACRNVLPLAGQSIATALEQVRVPMNVPTAPLAYLNDAAEEDFTKVLREGDRLEFRGAGGEKASEPDAGSGWFGAWRDRVDIGDSADFVSRLRDQGRGS